MANRNKLIQLVHIGSKKLFKDEEQRRDWQQQHGGHRSCSHMNDGQLQHLVDILKQQGALTTKPPKNKGKRPHTFDKTPYLHKIEAMLAEMNLSWTYAEAIAWRQTGGKGEAKTGRPGVERLEFLKGRKQFEALIAALEKEQKIRRLNQAIELELELAELDESYITDLLTKSGNHNVKWRRNLGLLNSVYDHLLMHRVGIQ